MYTLVSVRKWLLVQQEVLYLSTQWGNVVLKLRTPKVSPIEPQKLSLNA